MSIKLLIFGAQGFAGSHFLKSAIKSPKISSILALTRRPLDSASDKVRNVVHSDFTTYDETLIDDLSEYDACLWAIGGIESDFPTPDEHLRVNYTFASQFVNSLVPALNRKNKPFTFVYLSGKLADVTESSRYFLAATKNVKGKTENHLTKTQSENPLFSALILRPGYITKQEGWLNSLFPSWTVSADKLGDVAVFLSTGAENASSPKAFSQTEIHNLRLE